VRTQPWQRQTRPGRLRRARLAGHRSGAGSGIERVKNICAAGTFELETKGHTVELIDPVVEHDPSATGRRLACDRC
jgi:hypothetical protein